MSHYVPGIDGARQYNGFVGCPTCGKLHSVAGSRFDFVIECPEPCGTRFESLTGRRVRREPEGGA